MASYILIHGAWHTSWCWQKVSSLLLAQGHQVLVPNLPGRQQSEEPSTYRLKDYLECILALIPLCDSPPRLVGHSFAGILLSQVASRFSTSIKEFIYLSAYVPLSGESFLRISENLSEAPLSDMAEINKKKKIISLDSEKASRILYHDLSREDQTLAQSKIVPEPLIPLTTPVDLKDFDYNSISTHYIFCEHDRALAFKDQQWMAARTKGRFSLLPSGHSPFLAMPEKLVALITEDRC